MVDFTLVFYLYSYRNEKNIPMMRNYDVRLLRRVDLTVFFSLFLFIFLMKNIELTFQECFISVSIVSHFPIDSSDLSLDADGRDRGGTQMVSYKCVNL